MGGDLESTPHQGLVFPPRLQRGSNGLVGIRSPELAAARQALRRLDAFAKLKSGR